MIRNIYVDVSVGGSSIDPISVEVNEGYKQTCSRCTIEAEDIGSSGLNDVVEVDMGYTTDHDSLFYGFVDEISFSRGQSLYTIEARDPLKLAIEHWLVSTDLENPWSKSNIAAEDLVEDLLGEAQVFSYASYSGDASSFTFGTQNPAEFNLMSSWDAVRTINHILAYHCYYKAGTVYFTRMFPEPAGSKTSSEHVVSSGDSGNLLFIDYGKNTDNLRNKVVVFGRDDIYAEAKTSSPYLPSTPNTFYKTGIVSSELIDTQSMADDSADYNLDLYNRLTEFVRLDMEGNSNIRARDTVEVTETMSGIDEELWFVYSLSHSISSDGFTTSMSLSK